MSKVTITQTSDDSTTVPAISNWEASEEQIQKILEILDAPLTKAPSALDIEEGGN